MHWKKKIQTILAAPVLALLLMTNPQNASAQDEFQLLVEIIAHHARVAMIALEPACESLMNDSEASTEELEEFFAEGPLRERLENRSRELSVDDVVVFLGNRTDVENLLPGLDVVALTSNHEGLPNAVMEAMRAAKPVVATDAGGTVELVVHNETGFLVHRDSPKVFAAKLTLLLNDPGTVTSIRPASFSSAKVRIAVLFEHRRQATAWTNP